MGKRYLETVKKDYAIKKILSFARPIAEEEFVPVSEAVGRITSKPVYAKRSNPPFLCAAVDGYAVSFGKTIQADLKTPVSLKKHVDCFAVNTGEPLKEGTNAVIMVEDVEDREEEILIRKAVSLWENVRMVGEDTIEGDLLLPSNHKISALDIGLLLSSGVTHIYVRRKPRILFIPTGKELQDPYEQKVEGIYEFNSYTVMNLLKEAGANVEKTDIVADKKTLERVINESLDNFDIILINAGTSAGEEDFTEKAIETMGRVVFHGVSMMPGKPTIFGIIREKLVFGVPGYPVSAILSLRTFVLPLIAEITGNSFFEKKVQVTSAVKIPSRIGLEEIVRVNLIEKDGNFFAFPLPRGASLMSSLSRADGLIRIPEELEGIEEGEKLVCEILRNEGEVKRRINIIGSHDLSLDLLRILVKERYPSYDMFSIHTGSLSGLISLKKGISFLSTTHIFDEEKGIYNIPVIERIIPDIPVSLVHITKRKQGLLVRKGNPKRILDIEDLKRKDIRFVNRQKGSGTRILLDYILKNKGIDANEILGYDREESSHTAVGVLIKEDVADCGFGIMAVAKVFDLDFIPFFNEEYDLVVRKEFTEDKRFDMIMEVLNSSEFKEAMEIFGGYDMADTGKIKYVNG